jgi:hypothetical protein
MQETLVVRYANAEHHRYAQLCMRFGFNITVTPALEVGLKFVHPKGHVVRLDFDGEDPNEIYEPHLFIHMRGHFRANYDTPTYPEHYSDKEWEWLNRNMSDEQKPTLYEFFARELHIWFKVRPYSMV